MSARPRAVPLLAAGAFAAWAAAGNAARADDRIESCVSPAALAIGAADGHALLEADDAEQVLSAVFQRFPVLQRDGFMPTHLLLLKRPQGEPLIVALLADPARPATYCFTATISAGSFAFTPGLLKKYLRVEQT